MGCPDGVWYRCVDESEMERLVIEYLEGSHEVTEHVIHRLCEANIHIAIYFPGEKGA